MADKRIARVTVHMDPATLQQIDAERVHRTKGCPGASLSRSALLVQVYEEHQQRLALAQAPVPPRCGAKGKGGLVCRSAAGHGGRHETAGPSGGSVSWT